MSQVRASGQIASLSRYFRVAPFDATVFVSTILFILVLGYFAFDVAFAVLGGKDPSTFSVLCGLFLSVLVAYSLLRSVKGYRLTRDELVVERVGPGKIHVALENIASARAGEDLGNFVRASFLSLGNQGLFGWSGKIHVRHPTDPKSLFVDVYGTNPANTVMVTLKSDKQFIITPRDVQGFIDALRESGVGEQVQPKRSYLPAPRKKRKK